MISFFVPEIFKFSYYANLVADDITGCASTGRDVAPYKIYQMIQCLTSHSWTAGQHSTLGYVICLSNILPTSGEGTLQRAEDQRRTVFEFPGCSNSCKIRVKMMLSDARSSADRRRVKKAIACISALPVQDDRIHFFHKSIKDWLNKTSMYGQHDFTVDETEGHGILSKLCAHEPDDIKRKGVDSAKFSGTAKYALKYGVKHML